MAIARQNAISVGTTATILEGTQHYGWILKNNGSNTIFIGDSNVTTANGFPVEAGDVFSPAELAHRSLIGSNSDRLYGIVAAATEDARVLLMGRVQV